MGVAVRSSVRLAHGQGPDPALLHSRLALRGADGAHLPGYGWIFPLGGDLWNVGVGQLSTSPTFRTTDYRHLLGLFVGSMPASWGVTWVGEPRVPDHGSTAPLVADDVDRPRVAGAALPMGFDRVAAYRRGVLLTGDAAGLGNPFNGEGVGYALESGILAGEAIAEAAAAPGGWGAPASERALQGYHHALAAQVRGYFRVGRAFSHLIAHEAVMRAGMRWLLPHPVPMQPINRLMANLLAERGGGPTDWAVRSLRRIAVAV
jgi:2-polyprenyl-6-methoxyphenol hydroxylase-like FAD-dependent oxidoreductase